jgi:CBS domain-containing protein
MTIPQHTSSSPVDVLAQTESFRTLDRPTLELLVDAADIDHVGSGHALFQIGEPFGQVVYILYAGRMRKRRRSGEAEEAHLGEWLGLTNYVDRTPYGFTAEAVTDCAVLRLDVGTLDQLERHHSSLFNCLNHIIVHKLRARSPVHGIERGTLAQPVRGVMTTPVAFCAPDMSLREALALMQQRYIGSLVVTGSDDKLVGMLTRADLAEAVLLREAQPDDPVQPTACRTPHTITPETPLWKAQDVQQQQGAKYVVVVDDDRPVGVVSQTDILHALISQPGLLGPSIEQSETLPELAALKARLVEEAVHIREANRLAHVSVRFLSETHLALQRRVVHLTLREMPGEPPIPFAILIMGSGGRKEMLLDPDQDNGLIIAESPHAHDPEVQSWFEGFSNRLNENLHQVGYRLCPGDIMARNPMYRRSLGDWQNWIRSLVDRPTEQAARWSNILFDFDTLYGDDHLTVALRQYVLETIRARPRLLTKMAADDARSRPALGFFHQLIVTSRDAAGAYIDLKRNGLRLIADATRILAVQAGLSARNTMDRLGALVRTGTLDESLSTSAGDAHGVLLELLLAHQIEQAREAKPIDTQVDSKRLTEQNRIRLRLAMRIVKRLQDHLQSLFGVNYLN